MARDSDQQPSDSSHSLAIARQRRELAMYEGGYEEPFYDRDEDVIDLRHYWRVIMARKGTILLVLAIVLVATLIRTSLQTPIYRASTTLQIDRQTAKITQYEGVTPEAGRWDYEFYQTQYELLKSKALAQRVVDELGLESSSDFLGEDREKGSFFSELRSAIGSLIRGEDAVAESTDSEASEEESGSELAEILRGGLTVKPIRNSKLVVLSYDSPDKKLAAEIVNAVAKNFINMSLERRFDASSYAKTFLQERVKQVRADLEDSERALAEYAREREIIDIEAKQSILMHKIRELESKLVESEARRIADEAKYREYKDAVMAGSLHVLESEIIAQHKEKLAALEAEYAEKLKIYKPAYPAMVQLQDKIREVKDDIRQEIENIKISVLTRYKAALREEAMLKARVAEIKQEILDLQSRSTQYQALKRDVETNRELYDSLLQRMKEVGVASGVGLNNISVIDKAEVPKQAYKPNLRKNLMIALVLGLFGGIGLAFLFDHLDDTIKSGEDLEKLTRLPVMGVVPEVGRGQELAEESVALLTVEEPTSAVAEAYRSIRTALSFSTASGAPKVLHVTSSASGEGKTTTALALAIAHAQAGQNVLLIDADLRNPSLHKELGLSNEVGLSNYLVANYRPTQVVQKSDIERLWVLPTGPIPPNPAELLSSSKMVDFVTAGAARFDQVIIDSPPVLGLADSLILASLSNATLLVVDAGVTRSGLIEGALKRLRHVHAHLIGTVLAKYGQGSSGYGYDYHYHYDYYGYGGSDARVSPGNQAAS